jgi:hypothetical protein
MQVEIELILCKKGKNQMEMSRRGRNEKEGMIEDKNYPKIF